MASIKVTQIVERHYNTQQTYEERKELLNIVNWDNVERVIVEPNGEVYFYFVSGFSFGVKETLDEILKQIPDGE